MFPFGRAFTYKFYALINSEFEDLSSVDDPVSIYIYNAKPTRDVAAAGTGDWHTAHLIESITAWTDTVNGKTIAVAAIDDPEPTGTVDNRTYWIAINFRYAAGEQVQTFLRALPLVRPQAWHATITTSKEDLEAVFTEIDAYISATKQETGIELAKRVIELEFEASGFEWALIWDVDKLRFAVAYRAVSDLLFGLKQPEWMDMARGYRDTSDGILKSIRLAYDSQKEGEPTTTEARDNFLRIKL
jgi:hypothetical protein